MLTIDDLNLDKKLSVGVALVFSSEVLPLCEANLPDDLRPREAIESAMIYLNNPDKENLSAVSGVSAANANAANANAVLAAIYTYNVATTTYIYNGPAILLSGSYSYTNYAAEVACYAAHATTVVDKDKYIHDRIAKILPLILEYKIENKQSFNNAEKVLEHLNNEDKVSFLFNLDILR